MRSHRASIVVEAFVKGQSRKCHNTVTDGNELLLHGHKIAWKADDGRIMMDACGWHGAVTTDRLDVLGRAMGIGCPFYRDRGTMHLWAPMGVGIPIPHSGAFYYRDLVLQHPSVKTWNMAIPADRTCTDIMGMDVICEDGKVRRCTNRGRHSVGVTCHEAWLTADAPYRMYTISLVHVRDAEGVHVVQGCVLMKKFRGGVLVPFFVAESGQQYLTHDNSVAMLAKGEYERWTIPTIVRLARTKSYRQRMMKQEGWPHCI